MEFAQVIAELIDANCSTQISDSPKPDQWYRPFRGAQLSPADDGLVHFWRNNDDPSVVILTLVSHGRLY
jgi:hypothetical protein